MDFSMPGSPFLYYLLEFDQIHVHRVSDAIKPSHLFCLLLPSIFPNIRVFASESALQFRWPKYWSFSISPSNEYSGLISFRIEWFHLLAVQGTLKSLLQHHNSKASILRHSPFFMVQLSHLYMTTGKIIALTIWTFVGKVMSLLFYTLSKVSHSFPSKEQASFNFMAAVTVSSNFGAQENKVCHCFHFFPSICHKGTGYHDLSFLNVEFQASFFTLLFHSHWWALWFLFTFCHLECYHLLIWGCWYFFWQSWF